MYQKFFRETLAGAVRLEDWLKNKPKPIVPHVQVPKLDQWILGLDEFAAATLGPVIILIDIGRTSLPENISKGIVALAAREDVVVWACIDMRIPDNHDLKGLFCRQVSESKLERYKEAIPGLGESLA